MAIVEEKKQAAPVRTPLYQGQAQVFIKASPLEVYNMVADITRMGEYSPECFRAEWTGETRQPVVGARFRGHNKWRINRWSREAEITAAEPGYRFEFRTIPTPIYRDSTDWSYRFEAVEGGTLVTETFKLMMAWLPIRLLEKYSGRPKNSERGMQTTLERIKAAVEGGK